MKSGAILAKAKKLQPIRELVTSDGTERSEQRTADADEWSREFSTYSGTKWGSYLLQTRVCILERISMWEGAAQHIRKGIDQVTFIRAFASIKRKGRIGHYGISVASIFLLYLATPELFIDAIMAIMTSSPELSTFEVQGRVLGKESSVTPVTQTRTILPLPACLQIIDALIPIVLESFLEQHLPPSLEAFVGARQKTQCLDIAHALQTVIEKGIDDHGNAAIAQQDIQQFYDSLPLLRICCWMVARGLSWAWAACVLRVQLLPRVTLRSGAAVAAIVNRCIGGLTGSRVAGVLARIPVESVFANRSSVWRKWGYPLETEHVKRSDKSCRVLCAASWVDNIFSVSDSLDHAVWIQEDFALQIREHWGLDIKASSRSCMTAAGNIDPSPLPDKWPLRKSFEALGHTLEFDGSVSLCWRAAKAAMWKSFWGNAAAKGSNGLSLGTRLGLLGRATAPALMFRCSRWPPQKHIKKQLDATQRKMTAILLRVIPFPCESSAEFARRRGRVASKFCNKYGLWGDRWFRRAIAWDDHVRRPRNSECWSAALLRWRGEQFLQGRRVAQGSDTVFAGRTATRSCQLRVQQRWESGINFAKSSLEAV